MAGQRDYDSVVTAGQMSKANEFFDAADHLGAEIPNAAGHLYVDAGIAASDMPASDSLVCTRTPATTARPLPYSNARTVEPNGLKTLQNLKDKAAYTHQDLTSAELKKMNCAAEHLVEATKQAGVVRGKSPDSPDSARLPLRTYNGKSRRTDSQLNHLAELNLHYRREWGLFTRRRRCRWISYDPHSN